ncbi:hypothetical protein GCM10023191_055520 [Actinoallomurus oryzae]|uniref:Cytochrome P450 n=1 Tax=Actinoallomurus oryzae TaxID=502180 RepID=A0ABP8QI84_9ACTN
MTASSDHAVEAVRLYERIYDEHPVALYAELRRDHGPVVPVLLENDVFAWLVIGYRELHQVLTDYAYSMPVLVLAELVGVPTTRIERVAGDLVEALDTGDGALEAHGRVVAAMRDLVSLKQENPGTDVASRIVATHPGSAEGIAQDLVVVVVAGQEPVANWIGNTLRLMLTDDRFSLTLSGGRRSVGQALNEVLWEDGPVQNDVGRWAARDTELAGRRIRAGDMLIIGMAGANTDPHVRPGSATGISGNQAYLTFGHGSHGCPASTREIAEVIARTAVEVLLDRLPDVALAVPAEDLVWRTSFHIRGLMGLPVRFSPTLALGGSLADLIAERNHD